MNNKRQYNKIPTVLQEKEFNEFVLPHLKSGKRGPKKKLSFLKLQNLRYEQKSDKLASILLAK